MWFWLFKCKIFYANTKCRTIVFGMCNKKITLYLCNLPLCNVQLVWYLFKVYPWQGKVHLVLFSSPGSSWKLRVLDRNFWKRNVEKFNCRVNISILINYFILYQIHDDMPTGHKFVIETVLYSLSYYGQEPCSPGPIFLKSAVVVEGQDWVLYFF